MVKVRQLKGLTVGGLLGVSVAAPAQDIDLFMQVGGDGSDPNVLLMIDNTANWKATIEDTTVEEMTRQALMDTFADDRLLGALRIGLMPFTEGNDPRGGKVIAHVQDLTEEWRDELIEKVDPETGEEDGTLNDEGNSAAYALAINEALRYFSGQSPLSGVQDGDHDQDAVDGDRYVSPSADACGRNYQIVIGDGRPDTGEDNAAEAHLRDLGGVLSGDPISLDPDQRESNWSDEFARYMANNEVIPSDIREGNQEIITYVIDVWDPDETRNRPFESARALMRSIARWGDGRYFAAHSADDIRAALLEILNELVAENAVFASSTLPVSVNVRGTNLNQVYMGVFRPDEDNRPRWLGNLKLYQLDADPTANTLFLVDARGQRAQSPTTGFITNTAESFWTSPSDFWQFSPSGDPPSASDLPDGAIVEKGGAAQRLREVYSGEGDDDGAINFGANEEGRGLGARNVYTCTGDACSDGTVLSETFNPGNEAITQEALGVESSSERSALINWVRGYNTADDEEDEDAQSASSIRPSAHGSVLHSRPAVLNVEGGGDDEVYVFYGSNDGHFRAIRGGVDSDDGDELWSFVPEEHFGRLKTIRDNDVDPDEQGANKEYFIDGSIGVYQGEDQSLLFLGMRRGGRFLYALDVTDPEAPAILWRKGPGSADDNPDSAYDELGQTWSMPTPTRIDDGSDDGRRVVIFGAGYDPEAEDYDGPDSGDPGIATGEGDMGRGLFVVDADDGAVIWRTGPDAAADETVADMHYSMPSDPTVLDTNDDGFADRIYIGDTGGNVWRMDIHQENADDWVVNHLASFGDDQKFLFPPDVVYSDEGYDAVLLGAGNRENPFDTEVENHFYMIKDTSGLDGLGNTRYTRDDLFDATDNLIQEGTEAQQQEASATLEAEDNHGWFITLENPGEKVVTDATTVNETTFFSTNEPRSGESDSCYNELGTARNYAVDYTDGRATMGATEELTRTDRYSESPGGGFPPSPVPVLVEIDGRYYEGVISGTDVQVAPGDPLDTRYRIWWNREQEG